MDSVLPDKRKTVDISLSSDFFLLSGYIVFVVLNSVGNETVLLLGM